MSFLGSNTSFMNSPYRNYNQGMGYGGYNPVYGGGYGGMN